MTGELFTIPKTHVSPLVAARARLAKAEAEMQRSERMLRENTPLEFEESFKICSELLSAQNSVQVEENRELERLRAAR